MGKVQKTIMVHEDLHRLVVALEKRTGVSFARVMTAALLHHLFEEPEGPNPLWMEYVVEIEHGETKVADIPKSLMGLGIRVSGNDIPDTVIGPSGECNEISEEDSLVARRWRRLVNRKGDDPIASIIAHWAESARKR